LFPSNRILSLRGAGSLAFTWQKSTVIEYLRIAKSSRSIGTAAANLDAAALAAARDTNGFCLTWTPLLMDVIAGCRDSG
jgi:hypothetical protein